jgi:hypothetical protein
MLTGCLLPTVALPSGSLRAPIVDRLEWRQAGAGHHGENPSSFRRCNLSSEVETCFFVAQRNVLTPSDFSSLTRLRDRLLRFRGYCEQVAQPFRWKFNRQGLNRLMGKLSDYEVGRRRAA